MDAAGDPDGRHRKLSFIDCSVDQIKSAITSEWTDWRFNGGFWSTVLTTEPAPEFKAVHNRTLEFWIHCFNRWQDLGRRAGRVAPNKVDGIELEAILNMPRHRLKDLCKLFDFQGWRRLDSEGLSPASLARLKVPVVSLMTAGVLISQLIAPGHKLRFVFGLADLDDSGFLDEGQFVNLIAAQIRGFGAAFGILQKENAVPSMEVIRELGRRLYDRISEQAAEKLMQMSRSSEATKQMLIQAIRERQAAVRQGSSASVGERANVPTRQVLNYQTMEAWCTRKFKDPLALPYALAIERFCARAPSELYASLGQEGGEEWHLSHSKPVEIPAELDLGADLKLPERWQVLFLRDVYEFCTEEGTFSLSFSELEYGLRRSLSPDLWDLGHEAMRKAETYGGPLSFLQFLKKAFPMAKPKHLSAFEHWCEQYDELQQRSAEMDLLTEAMLLFEKKSSMPVLPCDDQASLEREFEEMDVSGSGCVDIGAIQRRWGWDQKMTLDILSKYDLSADGCLDKGDFLRMMCPDGYRLPSMEGEDRDVFGMLLTGSIRYLHEKIAESTDLYSVKDRKLDKARTVKPMPFSLLPEVPEGTWLYWNELFSRLDADQDDHVGERDLLRAGLLSPEVAKHLMTIIDPEHPASFTRRGFLTACLKASGCRRTKFECGR
ncbi:unnamed protein product [Effrenium voratum]|uniref:Calmodulin n=1 Tax=Effrenium voratum TaxID=2562239 RepID=A0AA36IT12_9DINO|nr:unnamed protein product [Effrenium voratum]CAJ1448672.1 unnamed protein product [Effrenium voratum]